MCKEHEENLKMNVYIKDAYMESNLWFIKQPLIYLALNLRANFSYYVFSGNTDLNSLGMQFLLSAIHGRIYIYMCVCARVCVCVCVCVCIYIYI